MKNRPPFKRGDWVAQRDSGRPTFGQVVDIFFADDGEPAWCVNIAMHDLKGNKVGRWSDQLGGPKTFEPACPASGYRKIKKPMFPIERVGLYGNYDHLLIDAE